MPNSDAWGRQVELLGCRNRELLLARVVLFRGYLAPFVFDSIWLQFRPYTNPR